MSGARRMSLQARILAPLSLVTALAAMGLAGCEPLSEMLPSPAIGDPSTTLTYEEAADVKYYASDEPLRLATENFNRGSFGLAERYFRDAVEKAPKDVTAWIGLAASYDRLARFDLADRAYANAIRLAGETTQLLNNQGYSYMLRGDLKQAKAMFMKAYQREPRNPMIVNNLQLLNSSIRYIQRIPN